MNLIEAMQYHHDREQAIRENSARTATQIVTLETTGSGTVVMPQPARFDTPFIGEPAVATGFAIRRPPDSTFYQLPRVTTGVFRWQISNDQGFHVGAFLYFTVDCPYNLRGQLLADVKKYPDAPKPIVVHHVTFSGLSYKRLPGMDQLSGTLPTRKMPVIP